MAERFVPIPCDDQTMVGILHEPHGTPRDVGVVILVGGPQYRVGSHRQFVIMARRLAAAGYPVLRFDFRGIGDSEGRFGSFEHVERDIRSALASFGTEYPALRGTVLFGLCDAASAAMMFCAQDRDDVLGLILANPWVRTEAGQAQTAIRHHYRGRLFNLDFWRKAMRGNVQWFASARSFVATLRAARGKPHAGSGFVDRMLQGVRDFNGTILLLISEKDLTAREFEDLCDGSSQWRAALRTARRELINDADHTFSRRSTLDRSIDLSIEWLQRI